MLIIDDFHHVQHDLAIHRWMQLLLENLPPNVRLVISTRVKPEWERIARMKLQGDLLSISVQDLAFQANDVLRFFAMRQIKLSEEELDHVMRKTEGWVIALHMIAETIQNGGQLADIIRVPRQSSNHSMSDLFLYLAMEVLLKQSRPVQDFLRKTSILTEITAPVCIHALQLENATHLIADIERKNLFSNISADGAYTYHPLFQEFLVGQIEQETELYRSLHKQVGVYHEQALQPEQALFHYYKIGYQEGISSVLRSYGRSMIRSGQLDHLAELLSVLGEDIKSREPILFFYEGEIARYRCQYDLAVDRYEQVLRLGEGLGERDLILRGLEGKANVYLDTVQPSQAAQILAQAVELIGDTNEPDDPDVFWLLTENLINLGRLHEAHRWFDTTRLWPRSERTFELEARLLLRTGRLEECRNLLVRKMAEETEAGVIRPARNHRETSVILSLVYALTGEPELAASTARKAIVIGQSIKSPFVEACGWIRLGHASLLSGIGSQPFQETDEAGAEDCYQTALRLMDEIDTPRGQAEPLMGLCLEEGLSGNLAKALAYGKKADTLCEQVQDEWLSALIRLGVGIAQFRGQQHEMARETFEQVREDYARCGDAFGEVLAHMWLAIIAHTQDEGILFQQSMGIFLLKMREGGYQFLLTRRTLLGPPDMQMIVPLLLTAESRGIETEYVRILLEHVGCTGIHFHPGYTLYIQTLGSFRVWLGDEEIKERDWQREKAKTLLQFLISRGHRWVKKEEIIDNLWPDLTEEVAHRDFKVALHALYKVLEPSRLARSSSFYIERKGSAYRLADHSGLWIDEEQFERYANEGLHEKASEEVGLQRSVVLLEKATQLYQGSFLPESEYAEWIIEAAQRLQMIFLRAAERLAQHYVRRESFDLVIPLCERIIQVDPTWEEAYRLLMYAYYRKNNRPISLKWFHRLQDTLERELGVAPMPETVDMFEWIKGAYR